MSYRQILLDSLDHQAGRIPIDFGSTGVSGIHVSAVAALRDYYGLSAGPVKVIEPYQMLGEVADDLKDAMGVCTQGISPRNTLFGFPNENWQEFKTPWGQVVLVSGHFKTSTAPDGGLHIYPGGDTSAPPSGHMPKSGFFFDTIIRQEPIDEANLDPGDNLEEFQPVSEADLRYFKDMIDDLPDDGRAVVANFGGTAFGDIALVPAPFLKHPKGIRDVAEWYMSTAMRQDYIHAVFSKQAEIAVDNLTRFNALIGDKVDVAFLCGNDFGTQTSSFCSTDTFDSLYAPYYKKLNDWIHANTRWKTFKHSCGAVEPFMSHFIDVGFDIINPVQCSATGMDPQHLKSSYGQRLTFWGGGVDTQKILPFGTPKEVREQVQSRCVIFGQGGGFVFDSIHNIQANTPVENMVAMIETVQRFNKAGC